MGLLEEEHWMMEIHLGDRNFFGRARIILAGGRYIRTGGCYACKVM